MTKRTFPVDYRTLPIRHDITSIYEHFFRPADRDNVKAVVQYLERNKVEAYLFGGALRNPNEKNYTDVDLFGVGHPRDVERVSRDLRLHLPGFWDEAMQIEIGDRLYKFRVNEPKATGGKPHHHLALDRLILASLHSPVSTRAPIDLCLIGRRDFGMLQSSKQKVYEQ